MGFKAVPKRREAGNATLVCHVRQIGVALDDVDDVENIVVAASSRIGVYSSLGDIGVLELELPYDRFRVNAGQPAEQQRVGGHQSLHVRDDRIHIVADHGRIVGIDAAEYPARHVVEDDADLGEIGVGRGRGRDAIGKAHGRCEKSRRVVLRRQRGEIGIVVDDVEDVEMARTQRGFCRRDAAEISAAVHRGCGRRERGRNIGQDRVDIGQRVAGELPRGYLGLKAGLHGGQIGGVFEHAAKSLAPFFDHVLPQTAHQGATRIIERQAKVREGRRRRCWGSWIGRGCRIGRRCRVGRRIWCNNWRRLIMMMMMAMRMACHGWLFSLSTWLIAAIDRLLSWRHSADTAADACRSKVIRGRIYVGEPRPSAFSELDARVGLAVRNGCATINSPGLRPGCGIRTTQIRHPPANPKLRLHIPAS